MQLMSPDTADNSGTTGVGAEDLADFLSLSSSGPWHAFIRSASRMGELYTDAPVGGHVADDRALVDEYRKGAVDKEGGGREAMLLPWDDAVSCCGKEEDCTLALSDAVKRFANE
mmetsp:Transcript_18508/g.25467  ORF Transcript_18508/g.25467 Transcript_18508/m.25467 type:complete len:114 (-) Transcript_18508:712-1053(-)